MPTLPTPQMTPMAFDRAANSVPNEFKSAAQILFIG